MCTCMCTHVLTHGRFALTLGAKEKAPSPVLFSFVCQTPFLPSPACFCLGRLKRAHHILAIRNDVFITVTTKDMACPPALPPAARSPGAAVPRSCSASPRPPPLPFAHVPPTPVLRPQHPSCSRARRSTAARPQIPGFSPFSSDSCFFQEGMPRNFPPFSHFLQGLLEPPERCCGMMPSLSLGRHRCCFFPWDPLSLCLHGDRGSRGKSAGIEGCGAERHRGLGPVRKEKALSHWVTRQQLLFQ